jgi:hypothetical protein
MAIFGDQLKRDQSVLEQPPTLHLTDQSNRIAHHGQISSFDFVQSSLANTPSA